jgi:hypothetical protein
MPIYRLQCTRCNKVEEKLFTTYVNFITPEEMKKKRRKERKLQGKVDLGYKVIQVNYPKVHRPKCTFCGGPQELLPSLTAMQPDPYWSGRVVNGEYVTKKSQLNPNIVPATRENVEYVEKRKIEVAKEKDEKASNNLKRYLTDQLSGVTIEPDGNTVKEKRKYERKRTTASDE